MKLNVNSINDFFTTQHNLAINTLSQTLMERDEEIYKSCKLIDGGWKPKEKRIRNIVDVHGELKYLRRIYRRWNYEDNCWESKSFLDEELGIKEYQKLTLYLELKILELTEGKRQKDIIDCFPWLNLSKMTISRTIRKYDIEYFSSHLFNEFEKINLE
ncbi:hypothetical protein [Spiroplasma endosymbiont of Poecilobothrus nobilitatus]|uniref:hypothetical protein n=1 Tax=Spiroplasma endosymbiont of Poecilobothrus nobilitatus TaxID=1209220 RepID=UPI00313D3597